MQFVGDFAIYYYILNKEIHRLYVLIFPTACKGMHLLFCCIFVYLVKRNCAHIARIHWIHVLHNNNSIQYAINLDLS